MEVRAEIKSGFVALSWERVQGASFYRVKRTTSIEPRMKLVATGLTSERYREPAPDRGETLTYIVSAVGPNGIIGNSKSITLARQKALPKED